MAVEPITFTVLGRTFDVYEILRLVIFIGAYLLFRPYVLKISQRYQEREHARQLDPGEENSPAAVGQDAKMKPPTDDDVEESDGEDMSWGAIARRRKRKERKVAKELVEEEERRMAEEESDEEIAEFLEKDN